MRHFLYTLCLIYFFNVTIVSGQDRMDELERNLKSLAKENQGLNEKVDVSVNGVSIQDFLRGLAVSNEINLSIDANLDTKIYNNFTNVTVSEVIIFLARKYDLEISFMGSIISISKKIPEPVIIPKPEAKKVNVTYDRVSESLSFDLKNDSIAAVAKAITNATDKNIIFTPDISNRILSGFIQKVPIGNALEKLAIANDLKLSITEDSFYLFQKSENETSAAGKSVNKSGKAASGKTSVAGMSFTLNDSGLTVNAYNSPISEILETISRELDKSYFLFSEPKGNTTLNVKNVSYDDFVGYLLNGTDYTYRIEKGIYLIGDRNLERLRETRVIQFKYRTVDKIIDVIPTELKKGVELKPFPDLNSIIVSGSLPRINEIEAFSRDIDRVVPVVVIEVLIVDVRSSMTVSTGLEAGLNDQPVSTGGTVFPGVDVSMGAITLNSIISGINGFGLVNLGKVRPNFYFKLKLLEQQGHLKLRSTPKLATLNGHEAKLSIGKTEYYLEISNNVIGSQNPQNIITQQYKSVNADLSVTINPMVSGDEQITLDIAVKQSNFTERISPSAPPGTITRDFKSLIRVKNEEMIILGGLDENTSNDSGSGLPLLSRIPVIKWLFSSRNKSKNRSKLTIFIKPTVLY